MYDPLVEKYSRYLALSRDEIAALESLPARYRDYRRGEVIVAEGSAPRESIVLISGGAYRFRILPDGSRQILAFHVPGDFMDLHSFVLRPLDHAIGASAKSRVARVPHERIAGLIGRFPRLSCALMWDMALDAATTREWMTGIGRRSAYRHIAHFFCELYLRMTMAGQVEGNSFELTLNQAELGDICGLSAVHVSRSLKTLRAEGLIVLEKGRLTIPDLEELIEAAGFEPDYLHLVTRPARRR